MNQNRHRVSLLAELWASNVVLVVKNPHANEGDIREVGLVPELGRSPGGGHSNAIQGSLAGYSP